MDNIQQILEEQERSAAWLARKIGISRQRLWQQMKSQDFQMDRKVEIALVLRRSLQEVFPEPHEAVPS